MMPTDLQNNSPQNPLLAARWGLWLLILGLGGFILWASFAPLGQGVPVDGYVKVEGNRKTVQHLRGGIIEEILVKEGDRVKIEQPLLRLNDTQTKAQLGVVESQLISTLAIQARLEAEQNNQNFISYPQFLLERNKNVSAQEAIKTQELLFRSRRAALQGEESLGKEAITGLEHQIQGLKAQEQSKTAQLKLFTDELNSLRPLQEQGYVPKIHLMDLERSVAYIEGQRSEDISNISRIESAISETRLKILQSKENYRKEVETQLTEIQSKVNDLNERLVAARDDMDRALLRSPINGIIVDLSVHTPGGVITPGEKLMDIVPEDNALLVEVRIPTHLIDNIHVGLEADIHFSALDQATTPKLQGRLVYVSADRLTDPRTEIPYYLGRVTVDASEMHKLGKHSLQPGMPADVVIKTGERTLMNYLTKPLLKRMNAAFTER